MCNRGIFHLLWKRIGRKITPMVPFAFISHFFFRSEAVSLSGDNPAPSFLHDSAIISRFCGLRSRCCGNRLNEESVRGVLDRLQSLFAHALQVAVFLL
jgi:hypothetical protein